MKNFLTIFSTCVCLTALVGCSNIIDEKNDIINNNNPNIEDTEKNIIQTPTEEELGEYSFEYTDVHFTHSPSENIKISITYPQFKDTKLLELNSLIEEFAKSKFKDVITSITESTENITLEEVYSVSHADAELVSVSSKGNLTSSALAYPSLTNTSINVNPITLKEYLLTDFVEINDNLVFRIRTDAAEVESFNEYLSTISDDDIKVQLQNSKFYRTDKNIIVLFEVPHAIGDIVEVIVE